MPAGKSHTAYLYVQTESFAPVGRNTIYIFLESEGQVEEARLSLRMIKSVGADLNKVLMSALQLALVLIVLGLIIGAGIIAYKKLNEDREPRKPRAAERVDDDHENYY